MFYLYFLETEVSVHSIWVPERTLVLGVDEGADPVLDFRTALLGVDTSDVAAEQVAGFLGKRGKYEISNTGWE